MAEHKQPVNKHILVIDDNSEILDVVREILTDEGYRVQTSMTGACLRHLESDLPDLILLDVLLQGEDGRELCQQVKGHGQTSHIPVVLFSAHIAAHKNAAEYEADDFLAKPFRIQELLDLVAKRI